jgi:hypothetical protein
MTSDSGIGVANHTGITGVASGKSAFDAALIGSTQNSNLLNYVFYDGSNTTPAAPFDFDLLFYRSFLPTDAFLIQERDGNTFFAVTPLGPNGMPIAGANKLVIGGNSDANPESSGNAHSRYNWGSGYALKNYQSSQEMDFTVIEASTFFTGTNVNPADQVVYGFRVDNNGNADVKFFGLSDDSFDNNPINPVLVPEASSALMTVSGILFLAARRRRQGK